jgi:hypothetical protein
LRKINDTTLKFLRDLITGDGGITEYKSGPLLVEFFNELGFHDEYGRGFPSRWYYTEEKLKTLNKQGQIDKVLVKYLSPINWIENRDKLEKIVAQLNQYLDYNGYEIVIKGKKFTIVDKEYSLVQTHFGDTIINSEQVQKQIDKCELRIKENDYAGAVTSARVILETVLLSIYKRHSGDEYKFKGNLPKLSKDVLKELNLTIKPDSPFYFKNIVSGLTSVVHGVASLSNELGDRHGKIGNSILPREYAILICDAVKIIAEFLVFLAKDTSTIKKES